MSEYRTKFTKCTNEGPPDSPAPDPIHMLGEPVPC